MTVLRETRDLQLRLGLPSSRSDQDASVLVIEDIPVGARVFARVDRPAELNEAQDTFPAPTEVVSSGGRTLTFADNGAAPDTITASAGDFIADGFRPGMRLFVDSPLNGGVYTLADLTALVMTLIASDALVAEGPLSGGETLNGGLQSQAYLLELAPLPPPITLGGVTFGRPGGPVPYPPPGSPQNSRTRVLVAGGNGPVVVNQQEPVWAGFTPAQAASLIQRGKAEHDAVMPGRPGLTPELPQAERHLLRVRWAGAIVAAATLVPGMAAASVAQGTAWASGHVDLAPGSVLLTLPTSGGILRDNGAGRLVGPDGDGTVDYRTGAFDITFNAPETGNLLADYEHNCLYRPLDVHLEWDALMAQ